MRQLRLFSTLVSVAAYSAEAHCDASAIAEGEEGSPGSSSSSAESGCVCCCGCCFAHKVATIVETVAEKFFAFPHKQVRPSLRRVSLQALTAPRPAPRERREAQLLERRLSVFADSRESGFSAGGCDGGLFKRRPLKRANEALPKEDKELCLLARSRV